jgi:hypothetical protein
MPIPKQSLKTVLLFSIQRHLFSLSLIPLIFSGVIFLCIPSSSLPSFHGLELEPSLSDNLSLYMVVLLQNPRNLTRISVARTAWHNDFKLLFPSSFLLVGTERLPDGTEIPDAPLISPERPYIARDQKLLFVFHDHLHEFLSQTKLRWILRTTEDVFVHLQRLSLLIRELEDRFDPLKDIVIQGQAVDVDPGLTFIHGGAGWIMSRACAEFYAAHIAEINRTFFDRFSADDMMPGFFKTMINFTTVQMTNDRFVGSPADLQTQERFHNNNYTDLSVCPSLALQIRSARMTMYLNRTTIWHAGTKDLVVVTDGYRLLSEAPLWAGLGHIDEGVTLCRADVPLVPETDAPPFLN